MTENTKAWLCYPHPTISVEDRYAVLGAFRGTEVPSHRRARLLDIDDADEFAQSLCEIMDAYPGEVVLSQRHQDIVNGVTHTQRVGRTVWSWFTAGTDCQCCLGWRVIAGGLGCAAAGAAVLFFFM